MEKESKVTDKKNKRVIHVPSSIALYVPPAFIGMLANAWITPFIRRELDDIFDCGDDRAVQYGIRWFEARMQELFGDNALDLEVSYDSSVLINKGSYSRTEFYFSIKEVTYARRTGSGNNYS